MKVRKKRKKLDKNLCLSCGKPLGKRVDCTHCGAKNLGRLSLSMLILLSLSLLFGGIILLQEAAVNKETPISKISELGEEDNFTHVRIVGTLPEPPGFYPDEYGTSGLMRFYVNDTTGEILVKTKSKVTAKLMELKRIPGFGDTVDIEGTLLISGEYMSIFIKSPEFLRIKPRTYDELAISVIDGKDSTYFREGRHVKVTGWVSFIKAFDFAFLFELEDGNGSGVTVFIPTSVLKLTGYGNITELQKDMYVSVKGALKWYDPVGEKYDKWEIIPSSSGDICILGGVGEVGVPAPGGYTVYTIAELLAEPTIHLHEYVRVLNATVTDAGSYAQGYGDDPNDWVVFEISDNSTSATLRIYCEREASRPLELTYGSIINVQGEFIRYETYWEIEIRAGTQDEVTVVTIATTER